MLSQNSKLQLLEEKLQALYEEASHGTQLPEGSLLSIESDAKTRKSRRYGYLVGIQYLAPSYNTPYNVCPKASPGCMLACLYTAGHGGMTSVQRARIRRTHLLFEAPERYWALLLRDLLRLVRRARREGLMPAVRLNGTSDLLWERMPVVVGTRKLEPLPLLLEELQFYDYTKIPRRRVPPNYDLTFSLDEINQDEAIEEIARGRRVAVVTTCKSLTTDIPAVDGDRHDLRFLDPSPSLVLLRPKGAARDDTSGFVYGEDQLKTFLSYVQTAWRRAA